MKHKFTAEQLEAARAAKSPEELMEKAKAQGIELTIEQAASFLRTPVGELSDEELKNAAGGGCGNREISGKSEWDEAAAAEGRHIHVDFKCHGCTMYDEWKPPSVYAREKRIVNNGPDEYRDCKCYRCGKVLGHYNTMGLRVR